LRATLRLLNHFVWSTEICYAYTLSAGELQAGRNRMVDDVLGSVDAQAWYPRAKRNRAGDPTGQATQGKYRHTVGAFLDHVTRNTHYVHLAAIVMASTAFEEYLESQRASIDPKNPWGKEMEKGWGPYCWSLSGTAVYWEGAAPGNPQQRPVNPKSVLDADVTRLLRNQIVHAQSGLALSRNDPEVARWQKTLGDQAKASRWYSQAMAKNLLKRDSEIENTVRNAINGFLGSAEHKVRRAQATRGKELPIEYFYMLFTFTALDALAFELEEALIVHPSEATAVCLVDERVRPRRDLLI
jgi:hypothetical protein